MVVFMGNIYGYMAILSIQPPADGEKGLEPALLGQFVFNVGDEGFPLKIDLALCLET